MTIDPTRDEWLVRRQRVALGCDEDNADLLTPEPAPKDWYAGALVISAVKVGDRRLVVIYCKDIDCEDPYPLTPDEADGMAAALTGHAAYVREQGDDDA
jgi:hypothetical protein